MLELFQVGRNALAVHATELCLLQDHAGPNLASCETNVLDQPLRVARDPDTGEARSTSTIHIATSASINPHLNTDMCRLLSQFGADQGC